MEEICSVCGDGPFKDKDDWHKHSCEAFLEKKHLKDETEPVENVLCNVGLDGLITKMRALSDDNRELLDATDDTFMRGQYNGKMNTYELCADMISMYRKESN